MRLTGATARLHGHTDSLDLKSRHYCSVLQQRAVTTCMQALMEACWAEEPQQRPAFSAIVEQLQVRTAQGACGCRCNKPRARTCAGPLGALGLGGTTGR